MSPRESPNGSEGPKFRVGKEFYLSPPDLTTSAFADTEVIEIGTSDFEIEGVGYGRARFFKDPRLTEKVRDGAFSFETPAGEIQITEILQDTELSSLEGSLPVGISVEIDNLGDQLIERVKCMAVFGGKIFEGNPYYDRSQIAAQRKASLYFTTWKEAGSEKEVDAIFFPPDPDILKRVGFIVLLD